MDYSSGIALLESQSPRAPITASSLAAVPTYFQHISGLCYSSDSQTCPQPADDTQRFAAFRLRRYHQMHPVRHKFKQGLSTKIINTFFLFVDYGTSNLILPTDGIEKTSRKVFNSAFISVEPTKH